MNGWRGLFALLLAVFVAFPLLEPFGELADRSAWSWTMADGARLWHLSINTLALTTATVALSLPLGLCLAALLFRTSFPLRSPLLLLLVLALFVPLPILVSSWQAVLGADGWLSWSYWRGTADRPWATGWTAAVWIHTLAALPWVTCIIGAGLTWVEPELEDEAAQIVGPWRVLTRVTLPRARASILAAALFVILQTAGEISVTDMMLISTLAEEVHTQFTLGDRSALARTLIVSLPGLLAVWGAVLAVLGRLEATLPPLLSPLRSHRPMELGFGWAHFVAAAVMAAGLVVPLSSLLWKVGLSGHPRQWSVGVAWHHLHSEAILLGSDLLATLLMSLLTGMLTAGLALLFCWLARDCLWFRWLLFSVLTWAWVLPGPVVGIGLHETIVMIVEKCGEGPWTDALYRGPSPLPLVWAQLIRTLPAVVVFLWPIVRMLPRELFEAARLERAAGVGDFMHVVWPMTWRRGIVAGLIASALCLGEVAASTRVETPGWESFTKLLFDRMHYGVDNNLAALAILMLLSLCGIMAAVCGLALGLRRRGM